MELTRFPLMHAVVRDINDPKLICQIMLDVYEACLTFHPQAPKGVDQIVELRALISLPSDANTEHWIRMKARELEWAFAFLPCGLPKIEDALRVAFRRNTLIRGCDPHTMVMRLRRAPPTDDELYQITCWINALIVNRVWAWLDQAQALVVIDKLAELGMIRVMLPAIGTPVGRVAALVRWRLEHDHRTLLSASAQRQFLRDGGLLVPAAPTGIQDLFTQTFKV